MSAQSGPVEPVRRSHGEARRTYDRISGVYDWLEGPFERRARRTGLRLLGVRPGDRVLDVGSGTGAALVVLARDAGPDGLAAGVDLSPGMQRAARRRVGRAAPAAPIALVRADAVALPWRDASFDAAFASFVLELFDTPEIPLVLAEVARVLRPGARLAVVALGARDRPGALSRVYVAGHRRFPRLLDCRPVPTQALLAEAGFRVETSVATSMWGLPVDVVVASPRRGPHGA